MSDKGPLNFLKQLPIVLNIYSLSDWYLLLSRAGTGTPDSRFLVAHRLRSRVAGNTLTVLHGNEHFHSSVMLDTMVCPDVIV